MIWTKCRKMMDRLNLWIGTEPANQIVILKIHLILSIGKVRILPMHQICSQISIKFLNATWTWRAIQEFLGFHLKVIRSFLFKIIQVGC